ncbi:mobilisation protein (MobC) [Streptosporangium subroseum]|uniref:Mobilisation protein (MobC) n=1 Tax=Streptosporangium subroseum TaxID=106412 RepID=A0A239M1G5_9ACTN|nr:plasmid mobilization relaxosome protein MobC [Streptosporangium subroseum]SNT35759.1 mobilisation protein (MobC) [Streptosporangium subroseum]
MSQDPRVRRRDRESGQGQRQTRVNLRLSPAEHTELQRAATRQGQTLAGYAAAAALTLARDELPPDIRAAILRLFELQHEMHRIGVNVNQLARHANASGEIPQELSATTAALRAVSRAAEETLGEYVEILQAERRRKARRDGRNRRARQDSTDATADEGTDEEEHEVESQDWFEPG